MDVALSANRRGVAKALRHIFDCLHDIFAGLRLRIESLEFSERDGGQNSAGPGAKILGGEIAAAALAKILIHVLRINPLPFPLLIEILKEGVSKFSVRRMNPM